MPASGRYAAAQCSAVSTTSTRYDELRCLCRYRIVGCQYARDASGSLPARAKLVKIGVIFQIAVNMSAGTTSQSGRQRRRPTAISPTGSAT